MTAKMCLMIHEDDPFNNFLVAIGQIPGSFYRYIDDKRINHNLLYRNVNSSNMISTSVAKYDVLVRVRKKSEFEQFDLGISESQFY